MIYNGQEVEFPAIMQVSFFKQIDQLESQAASKNKALAEYAKNLLQEVERHPELRTGITDIDKLQQYQEPIKKLCAPLFPEVLSNNEIKILTPPFFFQPLITSRRFDSIIEQSGEPFSFSMKDINAETFYLYCCYFILGSYYGYPTSRSMRQLFEIYNQQHGFKHTYKILINADMAEFIPTEKAVDISRADYEELINNFDDITAWKQKFPPNSWIMRGVNIVTLVDVTADQAKNTITSNLLVKSTDSFEKIRWGVRKILNDPDLGIGILSLENGRLSPLGKSDIKSVLLNPGHELDCNTEMCYHSFKTIIDDKEPFIVTDVAKFNQVTQSGLSTKLAASGFQSYMLIPLIHEEEFLGYIELGSKTIYALHKGIIDILGDVLPVLAMAYKRFKSEAQNMIEAIIQRECTTIHQAVKWRFEEEARKFMHKKLNGDQAVFKDIVFENLYPLYGQMDIKGSSERRNLAVSEDLSKQLNQVTEILQVARQKTNMQIFDELAFRAESFNDSLTNELSTNSEYVILNFLKNDINPALKQLEQIDSQIGALIREYHSQLDPELQMIYDERKQYDSNINQINQRLASYLDEKQKEAQEIFPHYFERYKTDGIEYNIYIGESITRNKKFNEIYLRNLRIWQLMVMCELENEFHGIQQALDTSIEIASLILVYNTPLAVHFRMDEKQFDVEGAYNARYEVIKKRVDKALIKGTNERATQPGSITIIYSQEQDAKEYCQYLDYLISKGYLKDGYEDLQLEDLQGVNGLNALRAKINYNHSLNFNQLISEMQDSVN